MGVNPEHFYKVILAAERSGIIDKVMVISGEALEKYLERTGYDLGDIFNKVDETTSGTIGNIDTVIGIAGPFVRFAANERLFSAFSKILDLRIAKRIFVFLFEKIMTLMMEGRGSSTLLSRLKNAFRPKSADQQE